MDSHNELSDKEFLDQFESCKLTPSLFSHEAHLRFAWLNIELFGLEIAIKKVVEQINRFANYNGAPEMYHHTVTIVAVQAVNHFRKQSSSRTFSEFIKESPILLTDFKALINSHYSYDIFQSEEARKEYIEPNISPFIDQ